LAPSDFKNILIRSFHLATFDFDPIFSEKQVYLVAKKIFTLRAAHQARN